MSIRERDPCLAKQDLSLLAGLGVTRGTVQKPGDHVVWHQRQGVGVDLVQKLDELPAFAGTLENQFHLAQSGNTEAGVLVEGHLEMAQCFREIAARGQLDGDLEPKIGVVRLELQDSRRFSAARSLWRAAV